MNRDAFEQQARSWRQKALCVSMSYGAGRDEAEDIAQDVMLRLWQMHNELERYDSVESLTALMARHLLMNHQRRRKPESLEETMIVGISPSPHEQLEMKENNQWLTHRLEQLPTTQRTSTPLIAQVDTVAQQIATPADTVTAQPVTPAETPKQPVKPKKRSLRKSEPTIHDIDKAYALLAQAEQEKAKAEYVKAQIELFDAQMAAYGYIPVMQEDGTINYINEQENLIAYEE
jgi:RNA polymerase sigma-70 factor (ECF subfamily)